MHFIVKATIPVAAGNKLIRSGDMQSLFGKLMEDIRPESIYFSLDEGQRTLYLVVDVDKSSEMPRIAEPLWLALEADVEAIPVMTGAEFEEAGAVIGRVAPHY